MYRSVSFSDHRSFQISIATSSVSNRVFFDAPGNNERLAYARIIVTSCEPLVDLTINDV